MIYFDFFIDLSEKEFLFLKKTFKNKANEDIAQSKKRVLQNIVIKKEIIRHEDEDPDYLIHFKDEIFKIKKEFFDVIQLQDLVYLEVGFGGNIFVCHIIYNEYETQFYEIVKNYPKYKFRYPKQFPFDEYNYNFKLKYIVFDEQKSGESFLYLLSLIPVLWSFSYALDKNSDIFTNFLWFFNTLIILFAIYFAKKSIRKTLFLTSLFFVIAGLNMYKVFLGITFVCVFVFKSYSFYLWL